MKVSPAESALPGKTSESAAEAASSEEDASGGEEVSPAESVSPGKTSRSAADATSSEEDASERGEDSAEEHADHDEDRGPTTETGDGASCPIYEIVVV
jgi:hypothetical protein